MSEEHIRRMIRDSAEGGAGFFKRGEVINVARNPAKSREYRIRPTALDRFMAERSVCFGTAEKPERAAGAEGEGEVR